MQHTHWATSPSRPRSRQQAALGYLFFALALVNTAVAQERILGDSDPAVQYTPPELGGNFCVVDPFGDGCKDKWWNEPITGAYLNSVKATGGPNTSLQVTFQGSMIQIKGVKERRGANAFFSIDNGTPVPVDTGLQGDGERQLGAVLWSFTGLDPKVNHTLKVVYDPNSAGRKRPHLLRIDSFEITGGPAGDAGFPPPAGTTNPASTNIPPPSTANPFPGTAPSTANPPDGTDLTTGPIPTDTEAPSKGSSTPTIPIVAGLSTGLATLVIASAVLFFLLRRRRAIRVESMHLPRAAPPPGPNMSMAMGVAGRPPQSRRMMYSFTRRGSSTASSSDAPRPPPPAPHPPPTQSLPPVPQINPFVSPYNYQRPGPSYPLSDDTSSIGLPVDERPPNIMVPISPVAQSPRVLRVYNPDGSTVVSSGEDR